MPAFRIPRRSGPHRVAAIALFRALLSQSRRLQLRQPQHDELQHLIRNRFKQARRDDSVKKLRVSFEAGYEAVDLVDAAVAGDGESKSNLLMLLNEAPLRARQAPPARIISIKKRGETNGDQTEDFAATNKPKTSLFDRPLPLSQLSGKRHVPVLVSANQIPMLRLKKPQPPHLSGFLVNRLKRRQDRHDRRHRLSEELDLAEREDEWDELVESTRKKESGSKKADKRRSVEPDWCDAIDDELFKVQHQLNEERRQNRLMAEKMQGVVDRERALFEKEKAGREAERTTQVLHRQREVGVERDGMEVRGRVLESDFPTLESGKS